jgi:hypothetical protein
MFCPGYRDNDGKPWRAEDCPFGKWAWQYQSTTTQWQNAICNIDLMCSHAEFDYDLGALRMLPLGGVTIQSRVGSHFLRYNIKRTNHDAFGYPTGAPDTGRYLYSCTGYNVFQHGQLRLPCGLRGGAIGGPWLVSYDARMRGFLDTVISHYATGYIDGPFQGLVAQQLYNTIRKI